MKIRLGVDAARSRLGRLEILDGAHRYGPFDACATADPDAARAAGNPSLDPGRPGGPAPFGTYVMKSVIDVDDARRHDLGDTAVMFEPLSGDARRAESLGRLLLALHGGMLGADGRMRPTSKGVRVGADVLARIVAAARSHANIELEIVEVPLTFWDCLFFWRRRPSRGFDTASTTSYRDDDDWHSSGGSSSSTSSRGDSFSGGGGQFGGAGASGGWDARTTATAAAAGAAIGIAGAAAASDAGSSGDATEAAGGTWSSDDSASSGTDGGGDSGTSTSY